MKWKCSKQRPWRGRRIKCREQSGQGDGNTRPIQCDPTISEVTVAQLIRGNPERVHDVVMATSDDYVDEVEADLGRSMKLPRKGGTTVVPKRGGTTKLPEKGGTPHLPGVGGTVVPNGEEYEISVGDWSQAFLQAVGNDLDGPPKFVSYRPYRGATLRIFRLSGSLYGMSQAPVDWYKALHNWLVLQMGFVRSENDKAMWMHPTRRLKVGCHVDDCILRGKRKNHTWFWAEAKTKFKIKLVEVDQPKMFCSKLIQEPIDCDGATWYSTTQEADIISHGSLRRTCGAAGQSKTQCLTTMRCLMTWNQ